MGQAGKLGLRTGQRVGLDHPPAGWSRARVDVKVAAVDTDWSGLRFVWRAGLRGAPT